MRHRFRTVPTPLFVATPSWYLDTDLGWTVNDLRDWTESYSEWEADPFGGWLDIAQALRVPLD